MVKFTERDVAIVAGLAGAADFLTEGRFSAPVARALKRTFRKAVPTAARTLPRLAGTAVSVGKQIALRHPVLTAGAVVYYTYKNREELGDLVEQGYEIIQPAVQPVTQFLREEVFTPENLQVARDRGTIGPAPLPGILERFRPKPRKPSSFNKAVSAGMKVVKKSTSYGKKGEIKPAKKAFSVVVKLAAAKKKKKKAPKSGIRRRIWNAMKGLR
jgi:hypothetical protein